MASKKLPKMPAPGELLPDNPLTEEVFNGLYECLRCGQFCDLDDEWPDGMKLWRLPLPVCRRCWWGIKR